jgi:hypothetical protein
VHVGFLRVAHGARREHDTRQCGQDDLLVHPNHSSGRS